MKQSTINTFLIIAFLILGLFLLCCLSCAGILLLMQNGLIGIPALTNTPVSVYNETIAATVTPYTPPHVQPTLGSSQTPQELEQAANETRLTMDQCIVPENDPIDLAMRLGGKQNVPNTLIDEDAPHAIGAKKAFWITDTYTNEVSSIDATLRYVGDHIYFWIEDSVTYKESSLKKLGDIIDQDIVPTNREFFGTEWNPGVDGDERFYILYAKGIGQYIAGYYSSADQVHPEAHPYSNAHEMFLLNADNVKLEDKYILGTIAHEYQHMIHWHLDKNEESWVNEGFSMLAEQVNGYDAGGFDWYYMQNTDMQLNDWNDGNADNTAHYGASYLFMSYFLDRFGDDATKSLVAHKENGFMAIDEVAKDLQLINPDTQETYTGIEFFVDWTTANLLQKTGIENRRYDYRSYSPYTLKLTESILSCPPSINRSVNQFGADYIELKCNDITGFTFQGESFVPVLDMDKTWSGNFFWWSNLGDESNMSLQREFDLSEVSGEAVLSFWQWYDIESDYDYAYLSVSVDDENWDLLSPRNCTNLNPSGNNYGCGWTGTSSGWQFIEVDLSKYAGKSITVRFDYVTDAAVHGQGLALDDIKLEAIGYADDFEDGDGGWIANGFVRIQNILPQTYAVTVVYYSNPIRVEHYQVEGNEALNISLEKSPSKEKVIIIISGTTIGTREGSNYQILFNK